MPRAMRLLYVGDPMCSWCYGFAPELETIVQHSKLPISMVMGGLRAFGTDVVEGVFEAFLAKHWAEVHRATGQPFIDGGPQNFHGMIYDTEPACRAMAAVPLLAPEVDALKVFRVLQTAFYVKGQNITRLDVLAHLLSKALADQDHDVAEAEVLACLKDDEARQAVHQQFEWCQKAGVRGFPSLLLDKEGQLSLLANGYAKAEGLLARMGLFG